MYSLKRQKLSMANIDTTGPTSFPLDEDVEGKLSPCHHERHYCIVFGINKVR